jgi:AraC family transcriptional regulator of adaptative response / DNA-3-methyladenine glycosylase II
MELDHSACYRALCTRDARFDGRIFTAVKTTGIYCRPVCPAKTPRRENVVFYASAAAAQEAGFRPCLRCRPETAPGLGAWRGSSNTVSRALSLIEEGALDESDVDSLAARLGVGERQLRRLFESHLGASPVAVAQTRRILLAKQLIHETRLPMSEVALAAGFGSIRRFNETFLHLFRRSPSSLRRGSAGDVAVGASGEVTILLRYRPPYDWDAMLAYLEARAVLGVEVVANRSYARSIALNGYRGVVTVQYHDDSALHATIHFPKLSALPSIIARLRRNFDLAADPAAIADHLRGDRLLAPLIKKRPGLRVPGAWDGFELAIRVLLGQQITVRAALALAEKLVAAYGAKLEHSSIPGLTHTFPTPASIAGADIATLGMPRQRAAAISSLASAVLANPNLLGSQETLEGTIEKLRELPGIGEWTAQYIAMRELREPDAFPAADAGLLRAMGTLEGSRRAPSELIERSEGWRPWRAYAAQHLWASLADASPHRDLEAKRAPKAEITEPSGELRATA